MDWFLYDGDLPHERANRHQNNVVWLRSNVFIVNSEQIQCLDLVVL